MPRIVVDSPSSIHFQQNDPIVNGMSSAADSMWRSNAEVARINQEKQRNLWEQSQGSQRLALERQRADQENRLAQTAQDERTAEAKMRHEDDQARLAAESKHWDAYQQHEQAMDAERERWHKDEESRKTLEDVGNGLAKGAKAIASLWGGSKPNAAEDKLHDPVMRSQQVYDDAVKTAKEQFGPNATPDEVKSAADAMYDRLKAEPNSGLIDRQMPQGGTTAAASLPVTTPPGSPTPGTPGLPATDGVPASAAATPAPAVAPQAPENASPTEPAGAKIQPAADHSQTLGDVLSGMWNAPSAAGAPGSSAQSAPIQAQQPTKPVEWPGSFGAHAGPPVDGSNQGAFDAIRATQAMIQPPVGSPAPAAAHPDEMTARKQMFVKMNGDDHTPADGETVSGLVSDDPAAVEASLRKMSYPDRLQAVGTLKKIHAMGAQQQAAAPAGP